MCYRIGKKLDMIGHYSYFYSFSVPSVPHTFFKVFKQHPIPTCDTSFFLLYDQSMQRLKIAQDNKIRLWNNPEIEKNDWEESSSFLMKSYFTSVSNVLTVPSLLIAI